MLLDELLPNLRNPTKSAFDYWREYSASCASRRSPHSHIHTHLQKLLGAECRGYYHKNVKSRTPATVCNYAIEIGRLFAEATRLGLVESNACARGKKPPVDYAIVRFLSDDERTKLLAECKASESTDLYPFVLFCLTTGCRKDEAAALEWGNVDLQRRWATLPRTKNGTSRGVPLTLALRSGGR